MTRKFYREDLPKYFAVMHLEQSYPEPQIASILKNHDITSDPEFALDRIQRNVALFSPYLSRSMLEDRRFYIALSSEEMGYGLFADLFIPAWSIVGEYTGVITASDVATEYAWKYRSPLKTENGQELNARINGRDSGSIVRFVNHSDKPNCNALHIPFNGIWRVVYVTNTSVREGEELFVDYGQGYWKERDPSKK